MSTRPALIDSVELEDPPKNLRRVSDLARRLADATSSMVTVLDDEYQRFLTQSGSDFGRMNRENSICQYALENGRGEPLHVPDLSSDPRTRDLSFEQSYGSYLGLPIVVEEHTIGTLCVLDEETGTFSAQTVEDLDTLAREVAERLKQQRTRRELERTNFVFDEMAQGIDEVFWMVDREFKTMTYVNEESFNQMFPDLEAQNLRNNPMKFLNDIEEEYHSELLSMRDNLLQGNTEETIVRLTDGSWVKYYAFPVEQSGEVTHIAGITSDITDIRELRDDIKEQKQRFQELTSHIDEVFWVTDPDDEDLIYVSPAFDDLWGFDRKELYREPQRWLDAVHPEDRDRVNGALAGKKNPSYDLEYRIRRPNGEVRWIHDKAFPIRNESGELDRIVGIAEDVTERVEQREKLAEAQKLANIGEMSAMIMHEINNPNGYIQGNLDYLQKLMSRLREHVNQGDLDRIQKLLDDNLSELVNSLREGTKRIEKITGDVKQFAREATKREADRTGSIDLKTISEKVNQIRERRYDDVLFECELDSDSSIDLPITETEFESVVNNLVDNALDATDPSDREIEVHLQRPDPEHILLTVRDNGKGMDEETQQKLLEPFESTKTSKSGTGLGMAIVDSIVTRMDGDIYVQSAPGRGTVFSIEMPVLD